MRRSRCLLRLKLSPQSNVSLPVPPAEESCRWGLIYRKVMTAAEVSSHFIPSLGFWGKHSFAGRNVETRLIRESLELKQDVLNHIKSDIYQQQKTSPPSRWNHLWHLTKRTLFLCFSHIEWAVPLPFLVFWLLYNDLERILFLIMERWSKLIVLGLPTVVKIYVGQRLQQWPSGSRQWKRLSRRVNIKPFASHPHTRMQFPDALITTSLIWMLSSILWAISEKYNNFLITYVAGKIWGVGFPRNNYKGTH